MPWTICRIDGVKHFEVMGAYRKRDLDFEVAFDSGFVGPGDQLIIVGPDGKPRGKPRRR